MRCLVLFKKYNIIEKFKILQRMYGCMNNFLQIVLKASLSETFQHDYHIQINFSVLLHSIFFKNLCTLFEAWSWITSLW